MSSQPMPWSSGVRSPIRGATALHVATKRGRLDRDLGRPRQLLPRNFSQEVEGCIGCLGLEYRRGSTKGSCASILGPIAWGSATYSNSPLPSMEDPWVRVCVLEAPSIGE